jgi:WD40 repeat protein
MPDPPAVRLRRTRRWAALGVALGLAAIGLWTWALSGPPLPLRATIAIKGGYLQPLAFSPNGSTLVMADGDGRLFFWDVLSGRVRSTLKVPRWGWVQSADFSPDGRMLAVMEGGAATNGQRVHVVDVAEGVVKTSFGVEAYWFAKPRFSSDNSSLTLINKETLPDENGTSGMKTGWRFRTWDTATGRDLPVSSVQIPPYDYLAVTADGRTVAGATYGTPVITLWDVETASPAETRLNLTPPATSDLFLFFSDDGTTLFVWKPDGAIEVWDVSTRQLRCILPPPSQGFRTRHAASTANNRIVVSAGPRTIGRLGSIGFRARRVLSALLRMGKPTPPPLIEAVVWDVTAGKPRAVLPCDSRPCLSQDGHLLATSTPEGTTQIWDLSSK